MFCAHCGSSNQLTTGSCSICGSALTVAPAAAVPVDIASATHLGPIDLTSVTDAARSAPTADGPPGLPPAFTPGRSIAGRYHIVRLLGVGGMGAVYQAWDEKLGVMVAIKVIIHTAVVGDSQATDALERRFKRELLLARRVTDKNVVRIHDLGEVDGTLYITMPYVQGKTLELLAREGKVPVDRVLSIARQVASGLAAAHEAGVVHRDLKPANIMIDANDDRALILDFGIARSATGSAFATGTGAIVGTLAYMAPEQAEGKAVDDRCDQYALGLILYDLVTGGRHSPESAQSAVSSLMARIQKPLPSVRSINPDVSDAFGQIIDRCLRRDPDSRYATTAELVQALGRLDAHGHDQPAAAPRRLKGLLLAANAVAILVVAATVGWNLWGRAGSKTPAQEPVSVLIADFENRANDPVFDGSIEQALTIGVEGASFITTYSRAQAHQLASQLIAGGKLDDKTAQLISVRDGVKFVLAGSIDTADGGYQIAARLIDPAVGKTLKTETTRARNKAAVLQAVGALAADIRRDLGDTTPESARLAALETFTTTSLEAVREYTIAQDLQNSNSSFEEAIPHYKRAIELDPQFGRAYSGWAVCSFELGRNVEAGELWKKALSLMDRMTDRERYRTLGTYYLAIARNYDQAIDSYVKLLERYPADRSAHNNLAVAYFKQLNFPKALEEGRKALDIYKGSMKFRNNYLLYAMYAGDFGTAETAARQLLKEDPKFSDAYFPLAISLLARNDRAGARVAFEQMAGTGAYGASRAAMGLADLAMYEGRFADAQKILAPAVILDEKSGNTAGRASKYIALAEAYQALGNQPQAFEAARKALSVTRLESVAAPSARIFVAGGRPAEAKALAAELAQDLQPQTRAYARIIEGEIALQEDRVNDSVDAFRGAARLLDVWLAHFDLGVAYVRAGHYAEALSELETSTRRRGEASAIFLDDIPSFRHLATLPYWLARAQEGVGMAGPSADNFKAYLSLRPESAIDPLAADARLRLDKR